MRKLIILAFFVLAYQNIHAQCDSEVCNSNTGLYSNDDASSIAYDNMGSGYHSTYIREPNSGWRIWGEDIANNGTGDHLSPVSFNAANYPALTGTIYKMGLGSQGINNVQLIVLTSTGLFALGKEGIIIDTAITTSTTFQKITVNGKADGLPIGIAPTDVKMMFTSAMTIIITTCAGEVYVLSKSANVRGNGGTGNNLEWYKVMQNATQPLTNVIVARGNALVGYALKSDGTIWTWGDAVFLGDGLPASNKGYATQMTLPAGLPAIKTIQSTMNNSAATSYYILGTDKKVYALGANASGQLGDRSSTQRTVWVNAKNPDNSIITDAAWISANEHDPFYCGLSVIKSGGLLYTAGINSFYMIGRTANVGINFLDLPTGVVSSDVITYSEAGGHTCALIKQGSPRYGYVGHRINGSMGNGIAGDVTIPTYDFITPPIVAVCGTLCVPPTVATNSPVCPGQNALFTISGTAGDIVTYTLNNGSNQTATIGSNGSVVITVNNAVVNQGINLNYVLGGTGACSNNLNISATVVVGSSSATPTFNQVGPICPGDSLSPLPTTSLEGISGSWSPALNNTATTTYTFTPTSAACSTTATMTITVLQPGTVPTFTQNQSVCAGAGFTLPAVSLEGIAGTWSPAIDINTTTTYTFTPSGVSCALTAQMTVVVHPNNLFPTFDPIAPICTGTSLNPLPANSLEGIPGTWSPAFNNMQTTTYTFSPIVNSCAATVQLTIVVSQIISPAFNQIAPICEGDPLLALPTTSLNNIAGSWSPALNNLVTTTYTFTPITGSCGTAVQMTIVVNPRITPQFTGMNTAICYADTTFNLPLVSDNNISGTWSPAFNIITTTTYTFSPDGGQCANPISLQVQVFDDFNFEYEGYCKDYNFLLEVFPNATFNFNAATINWMYNSTIVGTNPVFDVTAYLNSTPITETLPHTFTLSVTDINGCTKSKTIVLNKIYCGIQKGISVNNDGLNEFFDLELLEVKKLSIFNRYGVKVYSKDGYKNEWYGQTDKGEVLPDGTYYYLIDFENDTSKTGWIYLIKEY